MIDLSKCVEGWPTRHDKNGYPITNVGRKYRLVAKLLYELFVGPIPAGAEVRHTCDNRRCINPAHITYGTHADNMADAKQRRRHRRGMESPRARYNDFTINMVRSGQISVEAARMSWGMSKSQYYRIRNGESRT